MLIGYGTQMLILNVVLFGIVAVTITLALLKYAPDWKDMFK